MKFLNMIAAILLLIGGLNWGFVGFFNFDVVAAIGGGSGFARVIYSLVGLAAVYRVIQWKTIQKCWK